jgi:hypothetical protein
MKMVLTPKSAREIFGRYLNLNLDTAKGREKPKRIPLLLCFHQWTLYGGTILAATRHDYPHRLQQKR